jgi:hypothetical protein
MTCSQTALSLAKDSLLYLALALAAVLAVPVLAGLMLGVRRLLPGLLVVGPIALALSPTCRHRLAGNLGDKSW